MTRSLPALIRARAALAGLEDGWNTMDAARAVSALWEDLDQFGPPAVRWHVGETIQHLNVVSPDLWDLTRLCSRELSFDDLQAADPSEYGTGALFLPIDLARGRVQGGDPTKKFPLAISWTVVGSWVEILTWGLDSTGRLRADRPYRFDPWKYEWAAVPPDALTFHARQPPEGQEKIYSRKTGGYSRSARALRIGAWIFAYRRLCDARLTSADSRSASDLSPAEFDVSERAPDVRVTYLRRASGEPPSGEPGAVDWSSRWIVSAHKVRQWYPKEKKHKIIFRGPYVKGPADKPLRTTPSVKALVR